MKDIVEHDGYVADITNSRPIGRGGLHGQMMNIQRSAAAIAECHEYKIGHRDARQAAAELALKYDAIVEEADALLSELFYNLDYVGSDGWCRGNVHGDEFKRIIALRDKIKSL